jgi:hypothetical protein
MPGYPFVVVAHPFGSLIQTTVRARADGALALIERLLLGDREARRESGSALGGPPVSAKARTGYVKRARL